MEKLNEYLQTLLSTCGYELHLEPNKTPYVVNASGATEVANSPLLGTQISTIIFPLIPADVKQQLPNQSEIEFVHNHNLGNFSFLVKKSPTGFNVTIRPMLSEDGMSARMTPLEASSNFIGTSENFGSNRPYKEAFVFETTHQETPAGFTEATQFVEVERNMPSEEWATGDSPDNPVSTDAGFQTETVAAEKENDGESYEIDADAEMESEFSSSLFNSSAFENPIQALDHLLERESSANVDSTFPISDDAILCEEVPAQIKHQDVSTASVSAYSPNSQAQQRMDALFKTMHEVGASDLHLSVSMPPMVRKDGRMIKLDCAEDVLTPETSKQLLYSIMPRKSVDEFERRRDTDFAYEIEGLARFRGNIFADRKGMGGVFRIIPADIQTVEDLGLPKAVTDLCQLSKGLVVVTGPTGSGKSTTLSSMIDSINKSREEHIITIEDPIEFVHENVRCLINQREVNNHTDSFKDALRAALREDPDIVMVGEMRDLETVAIAIETAETGHLVFGTLHTTTAPSTVDRIIDQFPTDRQQQVRVMLAESLRGVIAQTLLPKKGGGRVAAFEILIITPAISNLIREGKTFQITSSMQTGKSKGMVMLNDSLIDLVKQDLVEPADAYLKAVDKAGFEALLRANDLEL